ncbi:MAG: nucleoside monophosphate kinase [Proteobacteria bacterium]|nr:nucleoside monophosphate kinase [Pseudomonadota bacterium]
MIMVFLGAPGSGKGTQARYLYEKFGFEHISTGDLLRKEIELETELGLSIKKIMEGGRYVDDDIVFQLIELILSTRQEGHILFDGFPRNINQAKKFDTLLAKYNRAIDMVIDFQIAFPKLMERLTGRYICTRCMSVYHKLFNPTNVEGICDKCGHNEFMVREDDKPHVVKKRLEVYEEQHQSLRGYYLEKLKLYDLDADLDVAIVHRNLLGLLQKHMNR